LCRFGLLDFRGRCGGEWGELEVWCLLRGGELFELEEELGLSVGYGLGVEGGEFGVFGFASGAVGFGGEEGPVTLGVGVTVGDGGGDLGCACAGGRGDESRGCGAGVVLLAAGAVGCDALGGLLLEGGGGQDKGRGGVRGKGRSMGQIFVDLKFVSIKIELGCGIGAQIRPRFREIV